MVSHCNINSITSSDRLEELSLFASTNDIDILCLTETKLDSSVHPSLYSLDHYHDPLTKHRDRHGGGVAIYVKDTIAIKRLTNLEEADLESIWCLIKTNNRTLIICTVYVPPNLSSAQHKHFLEKLGESVTQAEVFSPDCLLILGDLNAGNNYLSPHFTQHSPLTSFELQLRDEITSLNMTQLINEPTRYDTTNRVANLRDLIIVSNHLLTKYYGILPSFSKIDHLPIFVTLDVTPPPRRVDQKRLWDYRRMDTDKLIRLLTDTDWDTILDCDTDEATEKFTETFLNAANAAIPHRNITIKSTDKPWVTSELKKNIRKRDRLFRTAKKTWHWLWLGPLETTTQPNYWHQSTAKRRSYPKSSH